MSLKNNVIDLTQESDEESRDRTRGTQRVHVKTGSSIARARLPSQNHRDGLSNVVPGQHVSQTFQRSPPRMQQQQHSSQQQHYHQHQPQSYHQQHMQYSHAPQQHPHRVQYYQPGYNRRQAPPGPFDPAQQIYSHHRESAKASTTGQVPAATSTSVPKTKRRACVNCQEVNVTCDGEQPCSACVEPGLVCYYPGERPRLRMTQSSSNLKSQTDITLNTLYHAIAPLEGLTSRSKSNSGLSRSGIKQSDLIPNSILNAPHLISKGATLSKPVEPEPFYDSDESDDDDVPLAIAELEEVKRLLRKHEVRMKEHHAYLLQPLLNQAKHDAIKAPIPVQTSKHRHPFTKLIATAQAATSSGSGKSSPLHVQMKSHKSGAPKKWTQATISVRTLHTNSTILPKYKSIGRLGTSLLAPNIRTLKYWPYFPDEENLDPSEAKKNEELEERYQHDDNHLLDQRKCSELVDMWRPWVADFVSKLRIEFGDILYWFLSTTEKTDCETCECIATVDSFADVSRLLPKPTERSLMLARLSAIALKDVAKISMWHFVLEAPSVKDLFSQIEPAKKTLVNLCSVCFLHNCLSHGAYQEPEEAGGAVIMGGDVQINDEELNHNIRVAAAVPNLDYEADHQCSLYCVAAEARVKDILGRKKDGTIGGIHRRDVHVPRLTVRNDDVCSEKCYWPVERRSRFTTVSQTKDFQPKLTLSSAKLLKQLLHIYSDNQRVPCMLAKAVEDLECLDAFYYVLAETQRISHFRQVATSAAQQGVRKISKLAAGLDTTLSADLDERPPFVPCSHSGSCLNNPDCTCAQNKIHCEWFCGCEKTCERRFPGCKCATSHKMCFNDRNCECWKHNRECDPWLCGTCGVVEVLDPQNKYNDAIRTGRCKNSCIQLDLPARTIKAPSEVQGWGLYAGADLDENTFIGEYKGETVGNQESDRRGAVYANIGQEYLFVMNRDQQIDGSNFGNKTRFINNSQRDDYINIFAKKLLCNGVQRVMLYAKRPIKAGEELLYNYNYPISVTKKFWERGEGPTDVAGAVVAKPSIMWTQPRVNGRFARVPSKQDGEQSPAARVAMNGGANAEDDISAARKEAKRKRISEAWIPTEASGPVVTGESKAGAANPQTVQFPDDPDDSDFELLEASESSESVEAADADSDQGETEMDARRRRIIHAYDRRRGGLAQAKAWETRRKRTGKSK